MAEAGLEHVDWPALARIGLGVLRLPPDVFWNMTPRELTWAIEGAFGQTETPAGPMSRSVFAELASRFPDAQSQE